MATACVTALLTTSPAWARHEHLVYFAEGVTPHSVPRAMTEVFWTAWYALTASEVVIIGMADTEADATADMLLSLERGMWMRDRLIEAGVSPAIISIRPEGDATPPVRDAVGRSEPLNNLVTVSMNFRAE